MKRPLILILLALLVTCGLAHQTRANTTVDEFAAQLNLEPFEQIAVHAEGRVKTFYSHARIMMQYVSGARRVDNRSASFQYLDMMLRPEAYVDADVIFFKNKPMRSMVVQALRDGMQHDLESVAPEHRPHLEQMFQTTEARLARFMQTGLISPRMLADPRVHDLMGRLSADVLRTAKFVNMVEQAMAVMSDQTLRVNLKPIAPPGGGLEDRWLTFEDLSHPHAASHLADRLNPQLRQQIIEQWQAFTSAWKRLDATGVNDAAVQLLPQVNPEIYPEQGRLTWESRYFKMRNMTWVWLIYAFALVPLLLSIVFKWPAARWIGLFMFLVAFGLHTFAVMLRWYVAARWPNSNMFEAITTAAWFGGCGAILLEILVRRLPMRNIFALGSAVASMCALMAVHFLPLHLNPNISNMMPVLNDVWLYIHTNVIIFSYCLIFIAAVTATIYLLYRMGRGLMGLSGVNEYARVGGAASLILTRPDGTSYIDEQRSTFGQVLDGTTMVLMELAFITLWAGLVMGAIWADHSWGRPWGWDPKEVFSMNTFIVFLLLVHVRLKVKDKGLWTALLALVGAGVMLFNWIIINFAISGLHSYA
jgi:cytochrome c-type biogenesis protein CcsB